MTLNDRDVPSYPSFFSGASCVEANEDRPIYYQQQEDRAECADFNDVQIVHKFAR